MDDHARQQSAADATPPGGHAPAVPPGWPAAERPMRIAVLGWARLAFQGLQGSGYNLSASELAAGLAMSGHRVVYLSSGRRYNLVPRMYVRRMERWRGVECYDVVNSPVVSPASFNFARAPREAACPTLSRLVVRWLRGMGAEVVHVHSIEGYGLDLIREVRGAGIPVVVTPHNYHFVCPQVDLMHRESSLCSDYEGGRRCAGCLAPESVVLTRLKRRVGHSFERIVGQKAGGLTRQLAVELLDRVRSWRLAPEVPHDRAPDPESALGFDGVGGEGTGDGLVRHNFVPERGDKKRPRLRPVRVDENERFLAGTHHLTVLNEFGGRRAAGVAALNEASLVTPPSLHVLRVYRAMGLDAGRGRVVRLGQPHFDQINRRTRRSPYYERRPWNAAAAERPLRIAYFGTMRPSKGLDVLLEAVELLGRGVRERCQFSVRAQGPDWALRKRMSVYPEVSFLGGYDLLHLVNAGGEYDVGVLPHVWFENSPLVMLEHLHAGKFVICSRLGGPVEWIDEPRNGLMFPGGHADALAECIRRVVEGEVVIPSAREVHEATPILRSYPDHVMEVEGIYRELLGHGSRRSELRESRAIRATQRGDHELRSGSRH